MSIVLVFEFFFGSFLGFWGAVLIFLSFYDFILCVRLGFIIDKLDFKIKKWIIFVNKGDWKG